MKSKTKKTKKRNPTLDRLDLEHQSQTAIDHFRNSKILVTYFNDRDLRKFHEHILSAYELMFKTKRL